MYGLIFPKLLDHGCATKTSPFMVKRRTKCILELRG
jgi:hypothetical protein